MRELGGELGVHRELLVLRSLVLLDVLGVVVLLGDLLTWDYVVYVRVCALRGVAGCDGVLAVAGVFLRENWVHLGVLFMRDLRKVRGCVFVLLWVSLVHSVRCDVVTLI